MLKIPTAMRRAATAVAFAAAGWIATPQGALAHDLLLIPEPTGLVVRYGHPGDWQPIEPRKLIELQVFTDGGDAGPSPLDTLTKRGLDMVLKPSAMGAGKKPALVAGRYDNGLWARLPAAGNAKPRAYNTTRLMLPNAETVTANVKFAKGLVAAPDDTVLFKRQLGHLLELVPQRNPATLKAGEALPVLVLFNGKPLAGAGIELGNAKDAIAEDKIKRYVTGADGVAEVPLRASGVHMLGVDFEQANDGSLGKGAQTLGADKLVMVATYTFLR